MTNILEQTLATIVLHDPRTAGVLEKYQLDYCCKGKRTLADSCAEKKIAASVIVHELKGIKAEEDPGQRPFSEMSASQLINYILLHHHFYVKQSMPQIEQHLQKVVQKHGERFPEMVKVGVLFNEVKLEMTTHLQKEERFLFPAIKDAEKACTGGVASPHATLIIRKAIVVMESEHDHAGRMMETIRTLTHEYREPENACTTFKLCLAELKAFEEDLHKHVHLENYLLFPLAVQLVANGPAGQS